MLAITPVALSVALAVILGCCCVLLYIKRQRQARAQENSRIIALQRKIDAALHDEGFEAAREQFSASLKTASLTTGLQRPRLENLAKIEKQAPEKYRILGKLATQGLGAEEIASILDISTMEAMQLLSLSQVAKISR
jgi:hypothetical protein